MIALAALAVLLTTQDSLAWRATASYGFEAFTDSRSAWHAATLALSRHSPRLTAIAQADAYRRFDLTDVAAVADVYTVFRRGTYAEWRVQWAPDAEVVAQTEAGFELFHAPGRGWEVSAGYRHGEYVASAVDIANASAAYYVGDWYLRARGTAAFQSGSEGLSLSVLARRIGANPDDLAEVQGGFGEDIVTLGPGLVDLAPTAFVAARWQRRLTSRFGCSAAASWNRQEGIPNRAGLTLGVFTRW